MRLNITPLRIFHLIILTISTYGLGQLLIFKLQWTPLSAYGFGCTIIVQINNAILAVLDESKKETTEGREHAQERRKHKAGGNRKTK
jgi:hypothetical protein